MRSLRFLIPLSIFIQIFAFAAEAPPAKALEYHEALLKRPENETLFDRFLGAWIDEQDIGALEVFLIARAEENGGADLSVLARYQLRRGNEDEALETLAKAIADLPEDFSLPIERKSRSGGWNSRTRARIWKKPPPGATATSHSRPPSSSGNHGSGKAVPNRPSRPGTACSPPTRGMSIRWRIWWNPPPPRASPNRRSPMWKNSSPQAPIHIRPPQLRRGDLLAQAGRHDDAVAAYSATLSTVGEVPVTVRQTGVGRYETTFDLAARDRVNLSLRDPDHSLMKTLGWQRDYPDGYRLDRLPDPSIAELRKFKTAEARGEIPDTPVYQDLSHWFVFTGFALLIGGIAMSRI